MAITLTLNDYIEAAVRLKCETAAVMAVAKVEAPRGGFNNDGTLTALFEPHIFWRELMNFGINPNEILDGNEDILSPVWNKSLYPSTANGVYKQIQKASRIKVQNITPKQLLEATYRSCSWGKS
jgi:hypothetical protein